MNKALDIESLAGHNSKADHLIYYNIALRWLDRYRMEGNFGGCKLWRNDKGNIIGGINFGGWITKVKLSAY